MFTETVRLSSLKMSPPLSLLTQITSLLFFLSETVFKNLVVFNCFQTSAGLERQKYRFFALNLILTACGFKEPFCKNENKSWMA
jgi:hypothetical protein